MGIVNVTPDSFSDGGLYASTDAAIAHGLKLLEEGADILDVGGESTRPGALPVSEEEELRRVIPVIKTLVEQGIPVSVDTSKPQVMRAAIAAGAAMVNDVNALQAAGAMEIIAASKVAVCLMHKQGAPDTMQKNPHYENVLEEVKAFLQQRLQAALDAGIMRERIFIDPGFGFGKSLDHNLELLRHLDQLADLGVAVLVGLSRKSMLGKILGNDQSDRLQASVAAALLAVTKGAKIVRVHDVRATREALAVYNAISREGGREEGEGEKSDGAGE